MKYLFDTDHISFLQHPTSREALAIRRRYAAHSPAEFAFSMVSFQEQTLGAHNAVNRARNVADVVRAYSIFEKVLRDFSRVTVLPFDVNAATTFESLRAAPVRVATTDLRIASVALSNGLTLLARNAKDFGKVPGLIFEDWTL